MAGGAAHAQDADRQYAEADITVTGTRTAQDSFEAPVTVSVIDAEEIENNLATDIKGFGALRAGRDGAVEPIVFHGGAGLHWSRWQ